jgi:peptidyl-prolyl cis-trans isomerase A (cyclophilin A)
MRLLPYFLCFALTACSGPNDSSDKKGPQLQDSLKPKYSQDNHHDEKIKVNVDSIDRKQAADPSLNSELNIASNDGSPFENRTKLPVLNQDNVVALLTEFGQQNPQNKVVIKTRFGSIKIELFDETPLHRANFLYLVQQDYFKDTFFHRIVPNFIIQGGNSDLRSTPQKRKSIGPNYLIPAEINPNSIHTYGTISGAKEYRENPDKLSAPYEFFIFCGPDISGRHLNGNYTIFGRVTEGMEVVETIANLPADEGEWPKSNVYIEVSLDL